MSGGDAMLKACEASGTLVSRICMCTRLTTSSKPWMANAVRVSHCRPGRVKLVINHNRRWENVQRKLQAAIAAGDLGQLTSAEVVWPSVSSILSATSCCSKNCARL